MRHLRPLAAAALALSASCITSDDSDPPQLEESLRSTPGRLAFGNAASRLLPATRAALLDELTGISAVPPDLIVDRASIAVVGLGLDLPPTGATPVESAWRFVKKFQRLLDPRISWKEYRVAESSLGCGNAVVVFDRFVAGMPVIGSRLTMHFDDRGHLIYVTNGVAPVPGVVGGVEAEKLPGARPLVAVVGKNQKKLKRVPVLAPLPDGSGLHKADLVSFLDGRGKFSATVAVGEVAITGPLDQIGDGDPRPRVSPSAFVAAGEVVPSYLSYAAAGGLPINGLPIERNPIERAFRYLETNATVFRTGGARCQFIPHSVQQSANGDLHVRLGQKHATVPIFGAELVMTLAGDRLQSVVGHSIENLNIASLTPRKTAAEAIAITERALTRGVSVAPAWAQMVDRSLAASATTRLGVLPRWSVRAGGEVNKPADRLAWQVTRGAFTFYVDARDGTIRNAASGIAGAAVVTDGGGRSEFELPFYQRESIDGVHLGGAPFNPDTTPTRPGGNTSSALVTVQNTFRALGWAGLNGRGRDFVAHTNVNPVTTPCQNAFFDSTFTWAGFFCLGTGTNDIVGHEMTHGVIAASSGLVYQDESGAVNEAFADVIGNTLFREPGGGWLIGENDPVGGPVRNMAAAAHMSTYRHRDGTCDVFPWSCDNGFVHTNSAIINKAHQLLADGVPGATAGIGRDKLLTLAFATMTTRLAGNARMNDVPLAERDVCERFVATGATDLTGAAFTRSDCDQIATAFAQVGLAPGLTTSWSAPTLEFEGSRTFFASPADVTPGRCPVLNVEANLVQLSGAQTIDLDPATPIPSSISWLGLSQLSLRVGPGVSPFPIGTPFKRHTVDWSAIYGVRPSFYTTVIPNAACPPLVQQTAASATFDESHFFGNTSTTVLGNPASTINPSCSLSEAVLELVGDGGDTIGTSGTTAFHEHTVWFLFVPVQFNESATIITAPALGGASGSPRDLSGTIRYSYDVGRHFHVRWRYSFILPPGTTGITCSP